MTSRATVVDKAKVLVVGNLFPTAIQPSVSPFNKIQFSALGRRRDVSILVLVSWIVWLKSFIRRKKSGDNPPYCNLRHAPYFYLPKLATALHSATLFVSLLPHVLWCRRVSPEVVIVSWAFPDAVAVALWCRLFNKPFMIKVHGSDINVVSASWVKRQQILWAMGHAHAVISVSQDLKDKLVAMGVSDEKIQVVYNGVSSEEFFPRVIGGGAARDLPVKQTIILYVGTLKAAKGSSDLLSAFRRVARENPVVELFFLGSGPDQPLLKKGAEKAGLADRVHFVGQVPHDRLADWYNVSAVVCLPSHGEGVPNVLLEAMACGRPVVATRVGGIPEVVPDFAGTLVPHERPALLADALLDALAREWDNSKISAHAGQFSWGKNVDQLESLISSVLTDPCAEKSLRF